MLKMDFDAVSYGYNKVQRWAFKFFETFYLMVYDYDMSNLSLCVDSFFEAYGTNMKRCSEQRHPLNEKWYSRDGD